MGPALEELFVGDEPDAWRSAGFTVDDSSVCRIGEVRVRLAGREALGKGIRKWAVSGVGAGEIDGIPTVAAEPDDGAPVEHPIGAVAIDHLVLFSPDPDRTAEALGLHGIEAKREVRSDTYGAPMRQIFFRVGEPILELIGPADRTDGPVRFFGLALTVADLDASVAGLGERVGDIKDAVQEGRRIATVRHKEFGMSAAIALMSPEP